MRTPEQIAAEYAAQVYAAAHQCDVSQVTEADLGLVAVRAALARMVETELATLPALPSSAVFHARATDALFTAYNGQTVEVSGLLHPDGSPRMFHVRFADGTTTAVLTDELTFAEVAA